MIRTDVGRRRLLLTVEAVHEGGRADVERALDRLAAALDALGAVRQRPVVLDAAEPGAELFVPEQDVSEQDVPEQSGSEQTVPEQSAVESAAGSSVVAG